MRIIRRHETTLETNYYLRFEWENREDDASAAFMFRCTPEGEVLHSGLTDAAEDNLSNCLSGLSGVVCRGVVSRIESMTVNAIGACDDCEASVELDGATNVCQCGELYNLFGQHLAPMSQWDPHGEY